MSSTGSPSTAAGFTLLELLVVIAIMSLGLALVPAILAPGSTAQSLKIDMRQIVSSLRFARSSAIVHNRPVTLTIDLRKREVDVDRGGYIGHLAETTAVSFVHAGSDSHVGTVQFYPDGGSSGGALVLSNDAGRYRIVVRWLDGDVAASQD